MISKCKDFFLNRLEYQKQSKHICIIGDRGNRDERELRKKNLFTFEDGCVEDFD